MRAGRLAAALIVLALLASGCPSKHKQGQPTPTTTVSGSPSGTLTIAYPAEPATLDPFTPAGDTPATRDLARMLMPGLYKVTPSGARERWLLASEPVESSGPPFSVTIALRDDAVWSDGQPITVDDVRFTWQLAVRRQIARAGYDQIARIVTLSPKRARIEFRAPFRRWRDLFSAGLGVLPAHALSTPRSVASLSSGWPVSGGPFVLTAWHRGLDMIFEPNPHGWAGTPHLKRLRVVFVPDSLGALTLFHEGAVDALAPYEAPDWINRITGPGASVTTDAGETWTGIVMNTRSKLLGDIQVRHAFADSLDRGRLVGGLIQGEGAALNAIPPATSTAFATYGDIGRARAALSADGWSGSGIRTKHGAKLSFTIAVADSDELGQVLARAITYQAAGAGIDVQSVSLPVDELMSTWLTGARFDAAILEWRDPPEGAVSARFASGGRLLNVARLTDETLNRDLSAEDAAGAMGASEVRLATDLPVLPLATLAVSLVSSGRAHGLIANAEADGPFWNAEQWSVS
ncbi:MAG TPA: ABC transporter substrate-binding protein [Actinomycetota bacterium]|nr:ABC transporter substrate-binding protein [Actinomycetota bacterium]